METSFPRILAKCGFCSPFLTLFSVFFVVCLSFVTLVKLSNYISYNCEAEMQFYVD